VGAIVELDGPVAVVRMDWPEQRNAIGPDEADELAGAIDSAASSPDVCGLVLTGSDVAFCAGGNLRGMAERASMDPEERAALVYGKYQGLIRSLIGLEVVTVAAVDGPAVGMGFDLALACDSIVVGPGGWARQGWGRLGLLPATGGILLLRARAPRALWGLVEKQEKLDGPALERLGVADAVTEGTALARAVERVRTLSAMSLATVKGYVELSRAEVRAQLDDHLAMAVRHQKHLLASPEFAERLTRLRG
jgi:2-(1,2-epoxy-1,2-dihydrophenyl)acetyl-CoA isomerase